MPITPYEIPPFTRSDKILSALGEQEELDDIFDTLSAKLPVESKVVRNACFSLIRPLDRIKRHLKENDDYQADWPLNDLEKIVDRLRTFYKAVVIPDTYKIFFDEATKELEDAIEDCTKDLEKVLAMKSENKKDRLIVADTVLATDDSVIRFAHDRRGIIKNAKTCQEWLTLAKDRLEELRNEFQECLNKILKGNPQQSEITASSVSE